MIMLIGREYEKKQLLGLLDKNESQFCAVYGRRRVGKTFLIRETFNRNFCFQHTGMANSPTDRQLAEFKESLINYGLENVKTPKTWSEAFRMLGQLIDRCSDKKKVIFLDEISWLDTPKSGFLSALEHFWNGWATARIQQDIVLIVCGSATSWIINNIVKNHGGLHNRLTRQIYLKPFSLYECEKLCSVSGLDFSRKDILEIYMIMGGIPYYWNFLERQLSVSQNIDKIFFSESAPLRTEFENLYSSIFRKPEPYITVIKALGSQTCGLTRKKILEITKLNDNTQFTRVLDDLEQCSFIRRYNSYLKKSKDSVYQLIDNYTLFYFKFICENRNMDENYFTTSIDSQVRTVWTALAFERVCLGHIAQIKKTLGISGVSTAVNSWFTLATDLYDGAQIDLLIDRNDNTINICEIKYYDDEFVIDKQYEASLRRKMSTFKLATKTKKSVFLTLIASAGLRVNKYSSIVNSVITADDLFCE